MEILPSLISSDLLNLQNTIKILDPYCNGYHIDIMDDHFVPNLTWGAMFANTIAKATKLPLHIHLMVDNPVVWFERLKIRSIDTFVFHIEAVNSESEIKNIIKRVKDKNFQVGIAVNPKTDIKLIFDYLSDLDHILVMSVESGFSGQKFMPQVLEKVNFLIAKRSEFNLSIKIGMDGGIGKDNIAMIASKGVDQVGVASSIFFQDDYLKSLQELYKEF